MSNMEKIIDFFSNKNVQTVLTLLAVIFAFLSCLFAFRAIKPKIKVRNIKNTDDSTYNAFIESPTKPCAVARFLIENNSPVKAQIREICFRYKRKIYKTMNVYNEYFEKEKLPLSLLHKNVSDLAICKVPLTLEPFEVKEIQVAFPTFPNFTDYEILKVISFLVIGRIKPIQKIVCFRKVAQFEIREPFTMNGKTMYASTKNGYRAVPKKKKKS